MGRIKRRNGESIVITRNLEIVRTSDKSVDLNDTNAHVLSIERI